jgi:hypothetical protein
VVSFVGGSAAGDGGALPALTLGLPGGVVAGDQIVVSVRTDASQVVAVPAGFVLVSTFVPSLGWHGRLTVFRKMAVGGESSVVLPLGYVGKSGVVGVYRGVDPVAPVVVGVGASADGGLSVPGVVAPVGGGMLVVLGGAQNNAVAGVWGVPVGMVKRAEVGGLAWQSALLADEVVVGGATGVRALTFSQGAAKSGIALVLKRA